MSIIGYIPMRVIDILNVSGYTAPIPVYIGASNTAHMQIKHPADYAKYSNNLALIITSPDYVAINPKDGSIELIKEFVSNGEYVKVAVRIAKSGKHFARSLYVLNSNRVTNFLAKGTLLKV
mgnify:CR=1 FL=1